jgi:alpha-ketoglutarate-dependent taurine dioxygenase
MLNQFQITTNYLKWRDNKLTHYPISNESLFVDIKNPSFPSKNEIKQLSTLCQQHNMAFYRFNKKTATNMSNAINKKWVHHLGKKLGLQHLDKNICADEDKLTSIEVRENKGQHTYIPYTQRKLSWHTDGYYNTNEKKINGFLLHCARPAQHGGTNFLLDHEMVYILLYEENPDFITALLQPNTMTIPANILKGKVIRDAQTGPVFSFNTTGKLHMRYSARLRNIEWKQDAITQEATQFLQNIWQQGSPYMIKATLQAGEGVVCNNILHSRTAFEDAEKRTKKRLLYRGRYLDRII